MERKSLSPHSINNVDGLHNTPQASLWFRLPADPTNPSSKENRSCFRFRAKISLPDLSRPVSSRSTSRPCRQIAQSWLLFLGAELRAQPATRGCFRGRLTRLASTVVVQCTSRRGALFLDR